MTREIATLWYRSPEIILGKLTYGPEIDLWSLGTIIFEMLAGQIMFKGTSEIDMLRLIFSVMRLHCACESHLLRGYFASNCRTTHRGIQRLLAHMEWTSRIRPVAIGESVEQALGR